MSYLTFDMEGKTFHINRDFFLEDKERQYHAYCMRDVEKIEDGTAEPRGIITFRGGENPRMTAEWNNLWLGEYFLVEVPKPLRIMPKIRIPFIISREFEILFGMISGIIMIVFSNIFYEQTPWMTYKDLPPIRMELIYPFIFIFTLNAVRLLLSPDRE